MIEEDIRKDYITRFSGKVLDEFSFLNEYTLIKTYSDVESANNDIQFDNAIKLVDISISILKSLIRYDNPVLRINVARIFKILLHLDMLTEEVRKLIFKEYIEIIRSDSSKLVRAIIGGLFSSNKSKLIKEDALLVLINDALKIVEDPYWKFNLIVNKISIESEYSSITKEYLMNYKETFGITRIQRIRLSLLNFQLKLDNEFSFKEFKEIREMQEEYDKLLEDLEKNPSEQKTQELIDKIDIDFKKSRKKRKKSEYFKDLLSGFKP